MMGGGEKKKSERFCVNNLVCVCEIELTVQGR